MSDDDTDDEPTTLAEDLIVIAIALVTVVIGLSVAC
jgi:hypothetical protein